MLKTRTDFLTIISRVFVTNGLEQVFGSVWPAVIDRKRDFKFKFKFIIVGNNRRVDGMSKMAPLVWVAPLAAETRNNNVTPFMDLIYLNG
jgi:hypothetical protein